MKLSIQLFTVRDAMTADPTATLSALRKIGFRYVELAGTYGSSASEFRQRMDDAGLKASGCHVSLESLEGNFSRVVDESLELDCEWVIIPYLPEERRDWVKIASTLNYLGSRLAANSLKLAYHNHDFELRHGGLHALLDHTDQSFVFFQLDLGWLSFAGIDPAEAVRHFGDRAPLVHLKDMLVGSDNPHVVAGNGSLNWDEILAACAEKNVEFGSIEMDHPPSDPLDDVKACYDFFNAKGLP